MTSRIKITNMQEAYDKDVLVRQMVGGEITIRPGGSAEFWLYDGNQLQILEVAQTKKWGD